MTRARVYLPCKCDSIVQPRFHPRLRAIYYSCLMTRDLEGMASAIRIPPVLWTREIFMTKFYRRETDR